VGSLSDDDADAQPRPGARAGKGAAGRGPAAASSSRAPASAAAAAAAAEQAEEEDDETGFAYVQELLGDRLDGGAIVAAGHSFGAATVLATAERDERLAAVVAIDPWLFPLSAATIQRGLARVPVLALVGDEYTHWAENATALKLLLAAAHRRAHAASQAPQPAGSSESSTSSAARQRHGAHATGAAAPAATRSHASVALVGNGVSSKGDVHAGLVLASGEVHPDTTVASIPGTEHHSCNDFPFVMPLLMRATGRLGKRDPRDGFRIIADATAGFLLHWHRRAGGGRPSNARDGGPHPFKLPAECDTAVWEREVQ
jgi:dienelactone hydrolase